MDKAAAGGGTGKVPAGLTGGSEQPEASVPLDEEHFAELIAAKIALVRQQIERLTAEIQEVTQAVLDTVSDDEHDPEGTTITVERASDVAMLASSEGSLLELLAAQERLSKGVYGVCERCGRQIPVERLEVRPEARLCVQCASARRR